MTERRTFPLDPAVADVYAELREKLPPDPASLLFAILDLHEPVDRGAGATCAGCQTSATFTWWHRCRTVRLMADTVGVDLSNIA